MGKILVIAEKPSVGRDIARVLGCKSKGDGFLYSDGHIVSWAIGHLVTLFEPEDYDEGYKKWRIGTLPIIPEKMLLKPIDKTKTQLNILKKLMNAKDTDSLVCATDSGREGELIFRYIYTYTGCKKPFARLWISSMTDAAIKDGFDNIKDGSRYDNLYESARCRSEADWLVGINATRAYTVRYGSLLSVGRVQTPTLALLVAKQREIDAFVPEDYWEVKAALETADASVFSGIWTDEETKASKISDKEKAEEIKAKTDGKSGVIESIETEEKKLLPGQLYDLTELQRDCNKKFGYSAKRTLELAQDLYEKRKMITYPRTDSRYLSDDLVPKLTPLLRKLAGTEYKEYAEYVLSLPKLPITKRIVDSSKVTDHHAIIPTGNTATLGADERNVYDLIARKFIGVFYPAYICDITRVITRVEGEMFLSKGSVVVQLGFMELYAENETASPAGQKSKKDKASEEDDGLPPNLKQGDTIAVKDCKVLQKKTTPPKPYTEASLLSAMENAGRFVDDETLKEQLKASGLGTPATRAAVIERLIQVEYVIRKGKTLIPTDKAFMLISVVPPELRSPETTGKWEKGLMSIANGSMDSEKFMGSITRYVKYIVGATVPGRPH